MLVDCSSLLSQKSDRTLTSKSPQASQQIIISTHVYRTPSPTISPTPTSGNQAASTPEGMICSPLVDFSLDDLSDMISNPFRPPRFGSDDPHQGVDFSIEKYGMAIAGDKVQAVLPGEVAAIIHDRFPYGNTVLIETPFDLLPIQIIEDISPPNPALTLPPSSALTCPDYSEIPIPAGDEQSLYLLYAHLGDMEPLEMDQKLGCGDKIGVIGQTGNALNPHLHLEARAGPAGARFSSMAHYSTNASQEEMHNYCLWRISGVFRLYDPVDLLGVSP
jgi:murein DD-endopeptidase MepM/ murein hydrolase activator NlpD